MKTIRITDAQSRLPELVDSLAASGDVVITRGDEPVARLTAPLPQPSLSDIEPVSVGTVLRPFSPGDDLLEEMIER